MIEADEFSGYKMSIPFGQSSGFILKCGICGTEDQFMEAANLIDIEASLDTAQSADSADRSHKAHDNLPQSLVYVNDLIGKEIIGLMATSIRSLY